MSQDIKAMHDNESNEAAENMTMADLTQTEQEFLSLVRQNQVLQSAQFMLDFLMLDGAINKEIGDTEQQRIKSLIAMCILELGLAPTFHTFERLVMDE